LSSKAFSRWETRMIRALLFAVLFVIVGGIVFALTAPLIFNGADLEKRGAAAFPFIALIGGAAGFVFGLWLNKRKAK
jgi:hypothetical protein